MSDTFIIKNTKNTDFFAIKPGSLDGPSGSTRHSDLRLYGLGVGDWGEGVNQNLYRILENFACPQKELNDYNPTTGLFNYNPSVDPVLPKSEHDAGFGPGNGITTPILGQVWFNTTTQTLFFKRSTGWGSLSGGANSGLDAELLGGLPASSYSLASHNHNSTYALRSLLVTAGDGLVGGGDLSTNVTINIGTPSNVTSSSTNSVTVDSHTHALNDTGVVAGSYGSDISTVTMTVDAKGRLSFATSNVIRDATNLQSGVVSTGSQTFAGVKTFDGAIKVTGSVKAAGNFYAGIVAPTNTTRTNFDGYFYATRFYGDGSGITNINGALPAGSVIYHANSTAPAGYLKANGAAISRIAYADLFAAIGTTFGPGDGSTTFNLPDLRGEFIRGWADDKIGVDTGRLFGSGQLDEYESHTHTTAGYISGYFFYGGGGGTAGIAVPYGATSTNWVQASGGGTETRPRNVALLACIKY